MNIHAAPLDAMPLPDNSMDFGYCLGVLHHLPDPEAGLAACVKKLKRGEFALEALVSEGAPIDVAGVGTRMATSADAPFVDSAYKLVVYDGAGLFSAPRVWWTLRIFGMQEVAVLEGSLPSPKLLSIQTTKIG